MNTYIKMNLTIDPLSLNSVDDFQPDKSFLIVLGMLPLSIVGLNWVSKSGFNMGANIVSSGNKLTWMELAIVVAGFSIDDVCTSVGMQAEEVPRDLHEGNPWMGGLMQFWIKRGFAKTETAAHRLTYICFLATIFLFQYNGWFTPNSRVYLMIIAAFKAYSGYGWCQIKPNEYGIKEFITFKDGRPTPERMSVPMLTQFNVDNGWMKYNPGYGPGNLRGSGRRRLKASVDQGNRGAEWIQSFLYAIFPI